MYGKMLTAQKIWEKQWFNDNWNIGSELNGSQCDFEAGERRG